jgi:8-oxo-dGTP pyrophosphatase MutT (NUDIX family)
VSLGDRPEAPRGRPLRPAAVLIALVEREAALHVLLTRRTKHLHDHAGQISLPGGRAEPGDASIEETALREAEEEVGLARGRVEVLGRINDYVTVTGYSVTPVVGLVRPPLVLAADAFEVDEIFEVPLPVILDPQNHQRNTVIAPEGRRQYFAIPHERWYIWGATASMLLNLGRFLTADAAP